MSTHARGKPVRDESWIKREYNDEKWALMQSILQRILDEGETSLSRVLRSALHTSRSNRAIARTSEVNIEGQPALQGLEGLECVFLGQRAVLPAAPAWEAYDRGSASLFLRCCPADADVVVELGSGWGLRLADLWLDGAPKNAAYFGCEITDTGRACHELLARTEPGFRLQAKPFDYHKPDLSSLRGKFRNAFVFTHTSIEQIPALREEVFHQIRSIAPRVTVAHLEPIGWQIKEERGIQGTTGSSREYADANDYNRNFWPTLTKLAQSGDVRINEVAIDLMGINPKNTVSLVTWQYA